MTSALLAGRIELPVEMSRKEKGQLTAEISAEIRSDRPCQRDAVQFLWRYQMRGDNLTIVKPQLGYAIEVQFKEMHPVSSPVPNAAGAARGK
jgi:hypothetical protein